MLKTYKTFFFFNIFFLHVILFVYAGSFIRLNKTKPNQKKNHPFNKTTPLVSVFMHSIFFFRHPFNMYRGWAERLTHWVRIYETYSFHPPSPNGIENTSQIYSKHIFLYRKSRTDLLRFSRTLQPLYAKIWFLFFANTPFRCAYEHWSVCVCTYKAQNEMRFTWGIRNIFIAPICLEAHYIDQSVKTKCRATVYIRV